MFVKKDRFLLKKISLCGSKASNIIAAVSSFLSDWSYPGWVDCE